MDKQSELRIFTDGGSRGNPGEAALGVHVEDQSGKIIWQCGERLGVATNNVAEYAAVIKALSWLVDHPAIVSQVEKITIYLDSLLVCMQARGVYKVKNEQLQRLLLQIREKELQIKKRISYQHVPREQNKQADRMVNLALDNRL